MCIHYKFYIGNTIHGVMKFILLSMNMDLVINNVTILQYIYIYLYILYIYRQFIRVVSFTVACNKFVSYCSFASIEQRFRLVAICYHNDNNNTINVN